VLAAFDAAPDRTMKKLTVYIGKISGVPVAVGCLPSTYGNNMSALTATSIMEICPNLVGVIMSGIAGGVPSPTKPDTHVRLGDIVTAVTVFQSDLGRRKDEKFEQTAHQSKAWLKMQTAIQAILADAQVEGKHAIDPIIDAITEKLGEQFARPGVAKDKMFQTIADDGKVIPDDKQPEIQHPADPFRRSGRPRIFRGVVASSNAVVKSAKYRDELASNGVLAIEMEGSGVADASAFGDLPFAIVRGVCDYADRNKNKEWQGHAAVVAAACVKAVLKELQPVYGS